VQDRRAMPGVQSLVGGVVLLSLAVTITVGARKPAATANGVITTRDKTTAAI